MTKLTDQQAIKRGVELAKGWSIHEQVYHAPDYVVYRMRPPFGHAVPFDRVRQHHLDALAAQLRRQVNASGYAIYVGPDGATIWKDGGPDKNDEPFFDASNDYDGDEAMNTIRAVVESGVLG